MKPFIDSVELAQIIGVTVRQANEIIKATQEELRKKGVYVIKSRPLIAPRKEVFKKIGVEGYDEIF